MLFSLVVFYCFFFLLITVNTNTTKTAQREGGKVQRGGGAKNRIREGRWITSAEKRSEKVASKVPDIIKHVMILFVFIYFFFEDFFFTKQKTQNKSVIN